MRVRRPLLTGALVASAALAAMGNRTSTAPSTGASLVAAPKSEHGMPCEGIDSATQASPDGRLGKLRTRAELLGAGASRALQNVPTGSLFRARHPPMQASVVRASAKPSVPMPPPVPFIYLGKQRIGAQWQVFLSDGDTLIVAKTHQIIGDTYEVVSIAPPVMTLRYLPLGKAQRLMID